MSNETALATTRVFCFAPKPKGKKRVSIVSSFFNIKFHRQVSLYVEIWQIVSLLLFITRVVFYLFRITTVSVSPRHIK